MNIKFAIPLIIIFVGITGCATSTQIEPATSTSSLSATPTLSPTETKTVRPSLTPSLTPSTTDTPTEEPTPFSTLVPQNMLPDSLALSSILETDCFYQRDSYDNKGAYIAYECPGLDVTWMSIRFTNLGEGETATDLFGELPTEGVTYIEPSSSFNDEGEVLILARISDNEFVYFMIFETANFVISIESFFPEDSNTSMENYYISNADEIINTVLQTVLDNTKMATSPLPTLSAEEQIIADQYSPILISDETLQRILDEDWRLTRHEIDYLGNDPNMPGMCKSYLSSLRKISNCINWVGADFDLNLLSDWYLPNWEIIQPTKSFKYDVSFYGIWDNSWMIQGYMLVDEYLLYVYFDGIHIGLGASIADALAGYVDDYVSEILLENASKLAE